LPGVQIGGNLDCSGGQFEVKVGDALLADGVDVKGDVSLRGSFKATGHVRLLGAQIGGDLTCGGGLVEVTKGHALSADRANVNGSVFLNNGFKVTGEVRLLGVQIGGNLDCSSGQFEVMVGDALLADGADVKGDVSLCGTFKATGEVRLLGAHIGGDLDCSGGQFDVKQGHALAADRANVKGGVFLSNGFRAMGEVRLPSAQIGGSLSCTGGLFEVMHGNALTVDGASIKGDVSLRGSFKATGHVRLLGTQIGGDLTCSGGQFEVKEGRALSADRANVKGGVFLSNGFRAAGEVRLLGAQIGSDLTCTGGQFEARDGKALSADRSNVKGSVFLRLRFRATREVSLPGARIGGDLDCDGGQFEALSLDSAVVRGTWRLCKTLQPVRVNASHADVAVLVDDLVAWAPGSTLDGLRYAAFGGLAPTSGKDRLTWLCRQPEEHLGDARGGAGFRPQPWRQVQRVLREMGHTEDAKQVGIAFEDRLRTIGRLGESPQGTHAVPAWLKRVVAQGAHYAFGKLAGYGYRPINLVAWMVAVWFACGMAYWWLALPPRSAMAPSDPLVFQNALYAKCLPGPKTLGNWYLCDPLRGEYATFSPFAFSLDLMLPVVDLGQEKTWGAFVPTPKENPLAELFCNWHWGHAARLLAWFQTLFGWLSSLLLVAIVSGFSRRNDEG
jgi:sRNA-binding regulator protein Hfq